MLKFIDVFHGNPTSTVLAGLAGSDGIVIKASESATADPAHAATVAAARKAGKLVGHYHFGWLGGSAAAQASFFVKTSCALPGETLWLDVEREQNASTAQWPASAAARVAFVLAFSNAVHAATGAHVGHYCNRSDWSALLAACTPAQKAALLALPLWIADPSSPDGHPAIAQPWAMQQVGVAGGLDRDIFPGTAAAWRALGVPSKAAPKPVVAPAPKPVVAPAPKPPVSPVPKPPVVPVPKPVDVPTSVPVPPVAPVSAWSLPGFARGAEKAAVAAATAFITVSGSTYLVAHDFRGLLYGLGSAVVSGLAVYVKANAPTA